MGSVHNSFRIAIYPNRLDESNIRLVEPGSIFNLELLLQGGVTTDLYRNYLLRTLSAKVLPSPINIEQLIKVSLLVAHFNNPTSLTMVKIGKNWNPDEYKIWTTDGDTLCLFLDDGQDLGLATAFWNCRSLFKNNKIFLPKDAFLTDIELHASLIVEFMPSIRALFVTTPLHREEAITLYNNIKNAFASTGRELFVKIHYSDFRFDWINAGIYSGGDNTFSRVINPDKSVRFKPPIPFGHENKDFAFGYDAEVTFATGRKLPLPTTLAASILLSNQLRQIEKAENNQDNSGRMWLGHDLPVRTTAKGITGIAKAGKECSFYVHPDDIVITHRLKDAGFGVEPNKYTRYAQGFVKRFGGFDNVINLIDKSGADIISALVHQRTDKGGFEWKDILNFLIKQRKWTQENISNLLNPKLKTFLESGLIRRGYSLECDSCNLKDWYFIENVREFIECNGCADNFQLPLQSTKLEFSYKPNELAVRLVKDGGLAVIMTAASFNHINPSGLIQFGFNLTHPSIPNGCEVDLFWLLGDALIIAECKAIHKIEQEYVTQKIEKIKEELKEDVEKVAPLLKAQVVVLGVITDIPNLYEVLFPAIADIIEQAKEQKIAVHLILNWELYLWGTDKVTEPLQGIDQLQIDESHPEQECFVGESPKRESLFWYSQGFFNQDVLRRWEQEMGI